jgi:ubiquinone/menaquinone biosynthesis C-methylase UbiE
MLPRVLETEVMDTSEEAAEYDAMDHSEVNARFVADLLAVHGYCRGGTILDVGTGTALIPIALCQADPNARVLAIDLAEHMLTLAQRNVERAGLTSRIALHRADAKVIGPGYGQFEAVVSNSIVHHIPEPSVVLQEMVRLVAPGGTLFVRDLARPDSPEELDRLVLLYAGAESPTARALFAASLHAALTAAEVRELLDPHGLPADCVTMTSDRHWTCAWRRP